MSDIFNKQITFRQLSVFMNALFLHPMETQPFKLLIVDDEPEIGELLTYNFRKRGFEVVTASNGFTGFKALEKYHPDAIILDIMMPYVNGISMCKQLKNDNRYKDIPVVFLSATNNDELIQDALNAGGTRFISKPVHISLLIDMIVEMKQSGKKLAG